MKINNVWSLHFQNFLIEIQGTEEEKQMLQKLLEQTFPKKIFIIVRAE